MVKLLVKQLSAMSMLIGCGIADFVFAAITKVWWISIIDVLAAIFAFYVAWRSYKLALKAAMSIDEARSHTLSIEIHPAQFESEADTENCGTPI